MSFADAFGDDFRIADPELLEVLEQYARVELIPKGGMLIESGERQEMLPVLKEGVFRGYVTDEDGHDITDCFAWHRGDVVMGCNAIGELSRVSIEAVTDCTVVAFSAESVAQLMERFPELMWVYNHCLHNALQRHWELKMLLLRCDAMKRYQWFLNTYPGLIDVVNNKHVASFLGMTPVTLSRLRRQLREKNAEQSMKKQTSKIMHKDNRR